MESTATNIYKLMQLHFLSVLNNFIIETPVHTETSIEIWMIDKSNPISDLLKFSKRPPLVAYPRN